MDGELPDLKKKREERKKAGLAWGRGAPGGGGFAGATGAAPASVAAGAAARQAAGRTALERLLARLTATLGGQLMLAGGLAVMIAGSAALAHRAIFGTAAWRTGAPAPDLGALESSLHIRTPKRSKALDYLALSYRHELNLDADAKAAAAPQFKFEPSARPAPQQDGAAPAESAEPSTDWSAVLSGQRDWRKDRLARAMPGARLAEDLGGGFGGKSVFNDPKAPKFGDGFDRRKLAELPAPIVPGKTSEFHAPAAGRGRAPLTQRVHAKRAMGQLKAASKISTLAAGSSGMEGSRTLAENAFDGQKQTGGSAPASPVKMDMPPDEKRVDPLSPGAPSAPEAQHSNATDYQRDLDNAYNLGAQAGDMKKQSMVLMVVGLGLIASGAAMLGNPFTHAIGIALMTAGSSMVGMAIMLNMMAGKLAGQAKQIGGAIQRQYGQKAQNQIVDECMDQAISAGTRPESCRPKTQAPDFTSSAGTDARAEAASSYTIDDSNGAPAKPPSASGTTVPESTGTATSPPLKPPKP
jgi:hypothetical protein